MIFYGIEYKNDDHQIAAQFNNYFVNSIKSINNTIENMQYVNNLLVIINRFKFRAKQLKKLKIYAIV